MVTLKKFKKVNNVCRHVHEQIAMFIAGMLPDEKHLQCEYLTFFYFLSAIKATGRV